MTILNRYLVADHAWVFAIVGGALWIVHSFMEGFEPFGVSTEFRGEAVSLVVADTGAFILYNVWSAFALVLMSVGLYLFASNMEMPAPQLESGSRYLSLATLVLSASILIAILFQSPTYVMFLLIFSSLAFGFGTAIAGVGVLQSDSPRPLAILMLLAGILSIFSISLRPIVESLDWLPGYVIFALLGMIGLGWIAIGWLIRTQQSTPSDLSR